MTRLLFVQEKKQRFFHLALFISFLAFAWIMLGFYAEITGAALACPDWPECFGFFTVPHDPLQIQIAATRFPHIAINEHHVWIEITYRYLSAILFAFILVLMLAAIAGPSEHDGHPLLICFSLLLLVLAEITFKRHSIIENQQPFFLLIHALIDFAILSLLWALSRVTNPNIVPSYQPPATQIQPWAWLSLLLIFQIVLSAAANISYLNSACAHFPLCTQTLTTLFHLNLATLDPANVLHSLLSQHTLDLIAFCGLGYLCLFSALLLPNRQLGHLAFLILVLVATEILLGKFSATINNLALAALCHTAIAIFLLMTMISLLVHVHRKPHQYW